MICMAGLRGVQNDTHCSLSPSPEAGNTFPSGQSVFLKPSPTAPLPPLFSPEFQQTHQHQEPSLEPVLCFRLLWGLHISHKHLTRVGREGTERASGQCLTEESSQRMQNCPLSYPLRYPTGDQSGYCLIKLSAWASVGSSGSLYPLEKHNYLPAYRIVIGNSENWGKKGRITYIMKQR